MSADVTELVRLGADLTAGSERAAAQLHRAVEVTGFATVRDGQAFCPVDTGHLRSTVGVDFTADGFEAGPTAPYGRYVHDGTSRLPPRPFMDRAFGPAVEAFMRVADRVALVTL